MNKNRQEDACMFFLRLIDHFREKFKPLADIFEGDLLSTLTCQRCFTSYPKTEPFGLLQLAFPEDMNEHYVSRTHDLYDLLDDFVKPEIISGYKCGRCSSKNPTEKTLAILSTPKILVIQLKRFQGLQKIDDLVRFPSEHASIKYSIDGDEYNTQYRLMGIVVHIGASIQGGHYVSYVHAGENWFKMDDHIVSTVRWQTVRRKKAYMLFYEQI